MPTVFEIDGYHVVLHHVQNIYPVEPDKFYWHWGFKYISGVFEFFIYQSKEDADKIHDAFLNALNLYWTKHNTSLEPTEEPKNETRWKYLRR